MPRHSRCRRLVVPLLLLPLVGIVGCGGCSDLGRGQPGETARPAQPTVRLVDITERAGIRFRHTSGAFGKKLLPETMGSGCAFLDYDGDGRQDLLFVNSRHWPGFEEGAQPTLALYRNLGDGRFEDVTSRAGLAVTLYGMGVAVGDYDNDGHPDLFVTAVGGSHLYHNVADGSGGRRFVDATAGDLKRDWNWPEVQGSAFLNWKEPISFPSSAAFLDYDKDGKLDLFVCNYVRWSPGADLAQGFTLKGQGRAYGPPRFFEGTNCQLFRNLGDGSFEDVSRQAGIAVLSDQGRPAGKALGVIVCDADADGWPDVVVANDTVRNFFFHNKGDGRFQEMGQEAGVAYTEGASRGAMGIDWGEIRPGQCGLVIGNFANESSSLLRLNTPRRLLFADVAAAEGVAGPSRPCLTFGLFFFDYDLDGRLDLLSANGHLEPAIRTVQPEQSYRQAPQLYWNTGHQPAFELADRDHVGVDLLEPMVGRGSAYADIDGNGTLDVVLTANGDIPRLLRNDGVAGQHWLRLILRGDGKRCNRDAIGARVTVTAGDRTQTREVCASKGYLSCSELPLTFGLGPVDRVQRVEINWPGRAIAPQVLTDLAVDREHRIVLAE